MDVVLIILGVAGLISVIVAAYVCTMATRPYNYPDRQPGHHDGDGKPAGEWSARDTVDRRNGNVVAFPLNLGGRLVFSDRRALPDRRMATG